MTPINSAVRGSIAPRMAVCVEPMRCMATVVSERESAVENKAEPMLHPQ